MLKWIFRKKPDAAAPAPAPTPAAPAPVPESVRQAQRAVWNDRLAAAGADDAALLALAREAAAPEAVKLAAVEALATEAALKEAEREFRTHDRRVLRLAKQRLAHAVAMRTTREAADRLLASAEALEGEAVVPANRLVALDRDWQALDAALLPPETVSRFRTLIDQINAQMRDRAERDAAAARWTAAAREALSGLRTMTLAVAQGIEGREPLTAATESAGALLAQPPEGAVDTALVDDLNAARFVAAQVETRLALLAAREAAGPDAPLHGPEDEPWTTLPPVAEPRVGQALDHRWSVWQRQQVPAPAEAPAPAPAVRKPPRPKPAAPDPHAVARTEALLAEAEAALAEGHLAEAHRQLTALDDLVQPGQRGRLQALWAEHGRLRGWQQWGGARARDELVAEAEALAAATEAPDARIAPRTQADAIDALRKRWKELDRLGGATSQPLWLRFDAALKTAHGPVAAEQARLEAVRTANLEAREGLLAVLEATPPAEETGWREQVRALDTFQTAWRKLGPVEHTVPHKAREGLIARWRAAVDRIEAPLAEARVVAERGREQLIEQARALAAEAADGQARDLVPRVRDLQAEWQEQARTVPLARGPENALWARFKAETDAVFAHREAVFNARDDAARGNLAAREALVARVAALAADTPPAELKRTLAEVDAQWRQGGEVPRAELGRIEAAYREAREAAQGHLAASALHHWQRLVDGAMGRLALCERRERDGADDALQAEWDAQPAAPGPWARALVDRWAGAAVKADDAAVDAWLMQVEMALGIPSPEAYEEARREWKLRAMKAALESRQASAQGAVSVDDGIAHLLAQPGLQPVQRERFDAIVAAVRTRPR